MLEISFIIQNKDIVRNAIKNKKKKDVDLDLLEEFYKKRLNFLSEVENLNQQKKQAASDRDVELGKTIKEKLAKIEVELKKINSELSKMLNNIPNIPMADVPVGQSEDDNVVIEKFGEKKEFDFKPKPHWELGVEKDLLDFERAAKVAKSRFVYMKGDLAKLQFAIINWVLDVLTDENIIKEIIKENNLEVSDKPFIPVITPAMVNPQSLYGAGRLDPVEDKFFIEKDELFLSGSSEHTLASMYQGEILEEKDLPIRYVGYSTCFRREAGSYGKDTRGILRQHQFDKLEMESFGVSEKSKEEQDFFVAIQKYFLDKLNLHYQVVMVCTGDMGFPDLRQIDIETWMPGQDAYRETHSADLIGEFQSRRLGTRVKREKEKEFVHTNDATLFALGRILIAIIENNQTKDGDIEIPEVLRGYLNGKVKI